MHYRTLCLALVCAVACDSENYQDHSSANPDLGTGGRPIIDWTPLLQGGCPGGTGGRNQAGMAGSTANAALGGSTGGTVATAGQASVLETAGAAGSRTVATGGAATGGQPTIPGSAGAAGAIASMAGAAGSTGSGIRVLFGATYGMPTDDTVETMIMLENKSGAALALKDLQVQYFIKMDPLARMTCHCVDSICTMSTVGTIRTIYRTANAFISWTFPSFTLQDGRTVSLYIDCSMDDGSAIDESTHYSYPFGYEPGDPLPTVVVMYRAQRVWGELPQ